MNNSTDKTICYFDIDVSCSSPHTGLMIYCFYGMWNSTLELTAREDEAHASSYHRYDDQLDDSFAPDDAEEPYQGWSAEKKGYHNQQPDTVQAQNEENQDQYEYEDVDVDGDEHGYQTGPQQASRGHSKSQGRSNHGFFDED